MSMNTWTPRALRNLKGSLTRGKDKQPSCQADVFKKHMAKASRAYKERDYSQWCKNMDLLNGIKR